MDLEYYLEYSKKTHIDKYILVSNILEAGKWLSLPVEVIRQLEELDNNESEYAYLLLFLKEKSLKELKYWTNINTLEDILIVKKLLQQEYLENNKLDDITKNLLLSTLSNNFIIEKDKVFFKIVLNQIFTMNNIYFIQDSLRHIYSALKYIDNEIGNKVGNKINLILDYDKEIKKIYYKGNSLYDNYHTKIASLKAINYIDIGQVEYLQKYKIINPNFCLLSEIKIDNQILFSFDGNEISLEMLLDNILVFKIEHFNYIELAIKIYELLKEYQKKESMFFDELHIHNNFLFNIKNDNNNININMLWSKKYNDYYININKNKKLKFNVVEFINLFQKLFFFIMIKDKLSRDICIKDELNFCNKDFFKLIGLKS